MRPPDIGGTSERLLGVKKMSGRSPNNVEKFLELPSGVEKMLGRSSGCRLVALLQEALSAVGVSKTLISGSSHIVDGMGASNISSCISARLAAGDEKMFCEIGKVSGAGEKMLPKLLGS